MSFSYQLPDRISGDAVYNQQLIKWLVEKGYLPKDKNAKILDIGAGRGFFYFSLKKAGYTKAHAVDRFPTFKECKKGDITKKLPFKDKSFDIVISRDIAEHILDSEKFFNEQHRILKPGGIIIVMTPNAQYMSLGAFYEDYTHVRPFTPKSLFEALQMHNFTNIRVERLRAIPRLWKFSTRAFDFLFSKKKNNLLGIAKKNDKDTNDRSDTTSRRRK